MSRGIERHGKGVPLHRRTEGRSGVAGFRLVSTRRAGMLQPCWGRGSMGWTGGAWGCCQAAEHACGSTQGHRAYAHGLLPGRCARMWVAARPLSTHVGCCQAHTSHTHKPPAPFQVEGPVSRAAPYAQGHAWMCAVRRMPKAQEPLNELAWEQSRCMMWPIPSSARAWA